MPDALDPLCRPLGHGHGVPAGRAILRRGGRHCADNALSASAQVSCAETSWPPRVQFAAQLRTPGSLAALFWPPAAARTQTARRPPRRTAAPCPASTSRRPCPILRRARRQAPRAVRSRRVAEGRLGIGHARHRVGGSGGIRTHEGRKPLPVFKTGAFNRSATLPGVGTAPIARQTFCRRWLACHPKGAIIIHLLPRRHDEGC